MTEHDEFPEDLASGEGIWETRDVKDWLRQLRARTLQLRERLVKKDTNTTFTSSLDVFSTEPSQDTFRDLQHQHHPVDGTKMGGEADEAHIVKAIKCAREWAAASVDPCTATLAGAALESAQGCRDAGRHDTFVDKVWLCCFLAHMSMQLVVRELLSEAATAGRGATKSRSWPRPCKAS